MRHVIALLALVVVAGCGKQGQSAKMRDLYHCWELGWQVVESTCALGRSACETVDEWFESTNKGLTVIDSNKAFVSDKAKCAQDAVRGATVWNQLAADDITDDMAAALQELQTAVKAHDFGTIRTARARVRELLDLP